MQQKLIGLIISLALIAAVPGSGTGQQREGETIGEIAQILSGGRTRKLKKPSPAVQVQSQGSPQWSEAAPGTLLRWNDLVKVARNVQVKVDVRRSSQRGILTFATEPLQRKARPIYYAVASEPVTDALYELARDSVRQRDLAIDIKRGALIVDWLHGNLSITAAGQPIHVYGTRLVVWVDPSGDEALIFLESGQILLPQYPALKAVPGHEVRLRRGQPPQIRPAGVQLSANYQNAIQYSTQDIWTELAPFWRQPAFLIPAAQVVAAATIAGVIVATKADDTAAGTITIRIPF